MGNREHRSSVARRQPQTLCASGCDDIWDRADISPHTRWARGLAHPGVLGPICSGRFSMPESSNETSWRSSLLREKKKSGLPTRLTEENASFDLAAR